MDALDLPAAQSVLVVIDVQEKLVAAMSAEAGARAVSATCTLVRGARRLGIPVLVTEQYPRGLGPTDAKVRDALETFTAIEKLEFDATANEGFSSALHALGRSVVVLAGMESHICVYQTARGLARRGVHVHVAADATCARAPDNAEIARGLWARAGAVVTSTEAVLFDWVGRAGTEEFKAVSRLVK